jgi:hypothetical protein
VIPVSLTNKAISRATGSGKDRAPPDFSRKAVARYDASCAGVHVFGSDGRSSRMTGEAPLDTGADEGNVSARFERRGVFSSVNPSSEREGTEKEGGTGKGNGLSPLRDLLYLCPRPCRAAGRFGLRFWL